MTTILESKLDPRTAVLDEVCPAGEPWSHLIEKGQIFRKDAPQIGKA